VRGNDIIASMARIAHRWIPDYRQGLNPSNLASPTSSSNAPGEYLGGKLRTLFGARRDYYRNRVTQAVRVPATGLNDRTGQPDFLSNCRT
jgi:hypothetical protein